MKRILFILLLPFIGFAQVIPAGDYIISSSYATDAYPNFRNLTTAVAYLNSHGIGGNVRFLLDNDQTASSQITITAFTNTTNSTVTIKPNSGKTIKITANKLNPSTGVPAVFLFNGAKNIIIDGSNSSLETKNLELINNDDLGYIYRSVIWIASNSAIPSSNITVKNSTLKFINRTNQNNLLAAVYSGNNTIGGNNTISMSASTASNSNIIIKNNEFVNIKEGVHINGDSDASKRPINWSIQNNKMIGGTANVDKLNRAIYVSNSNNFMISNNFISGVLRYSNSTFQETAGIAIVGGSSGTIDSNTIDDVANVSYASDGSTGGIFINVNTGMTITVSNNMISKVYTGATDSNDYNYYYKGFGIYVKSGGTTNLYFNTVLLNQPSAGGLTACLYIEGGSSFNIRNNIFYNSQSGTQYGIFSSVAASNINSISNNAYYVTSPSGNFSNRLGATYTGTTGFTNWKTALGNKDSGSIIQLPTFVSSTDLHLQDVAANAALKAGTPISGITTDIDSASRSTTVPYIGADEICSITEPKLVSITQPNCVTATGSVVLNGLPASGTWTLNRKVGTTTVTGTGTEVTVSGLAVGTYNFSVTNASGCTSAFSVDVVINPIVTTTWNGTSWNNGDPTKDKLVEIKADYFITAITGDLNACSLTIDAGFKLTVQADRFLIIQNDLTVDGTLNVLDKGSLVMVNDAGIVKNNGATNIHRITTEYKKLDYVYWSTPVTSTTISNTFSGWRTDRAFEYNNNWIYATVMTPAKGYIITVPNPVSSPSPFTPPSVAEVIFTGKVNNGEQKITNLTPSNYYLIGNPYPSALDANTFLNDNSGALDGTIYFWTHNTAIKLASELNPGTAGSGAYAFTSDDYASYNLVGGVGTSKSSKSNSSLKPTGSIASCQGFFAMSKPSITSTEIVFNNAMRLGSGATKLDNSNFFRTKNSKSKATAAFERHRIWLNLSNKGGAFKQTLVGYVTDATNENDSRFDGETMDGNAFVDFYSVNANKNLVIQGRALPFDDTDEVAIGFKSAIAGEFNISIDEVDGILTNQAVFLEDKLTNTEFDLKKGSYTFNTEKGTFNNRFVLKYKSSNKTLGTGDFDAQTNQVLVIVKDKQIKINATETIKNVVIYDLSGRQLYQKNDVDANEFLVTDFVSSRQVLIVKTSLQNGTITTDKIIF